VLPKEAGVYLTNHGRMSFVGKAWLFSRMDVDVETFFWLEEVTEAKVEVEEMAEAYAKSEALIYVEKHPFPPGFPKDGAERLMKKFEEQAKKDYIAGSKLLPTF
jgi:hypothetical protein